MGDTANLIMNWRSTMMFMVCLPILLCACLLLFKKYEKLASVFLSIALFASVIAMVPQIIGFAGFYYVWPGLTFAPFSTDLWIGPLIYLHAFALLKQQPLSWRWLLLAPGLLQTLYYSWAFLFLGDYKNKWAFNDSFHEPFIVPIETVLGIVLIVSAIIFTWQMYTQYKQYIYQTESVAIEFDPVWLKRIIILMVAAGTIYIVIEIVVFVFKLSYVATFPMLIVIMLIIAWLSVEAVWRLNQHFPKLPYNLTLLNSVTNTSNSPHDFANLDIEKSSKTIHEDDDALKELAYDIVASVKDKSWFLQTRFSLKDLAKHMGTNEAYVSRAINKVLEKSFNDFINQFRVDYSKELMHSSQLPILNIALESGFGSKATFNRVFKTVAGKTPSEYKKEIGLKS